MKRNFLLILFLSVATSLLYGADIEIQSATNSRMTDLAVAKLNKIIQNLPEQHGQQMIVLINAALEAPKLKALQLTGTGLQSEAFRIHKRGEKVYIVGGDEKGLMYGILDVRDQLRLGRNFDRIEERSESPAIPFPGDQVQLTLVVLPPGRILAIAYGHGQGHRFLGGISGYDDGQSFQCPDAVEPASLHVYDPT